jgi:uncharacterized protein YpuA (DUF1002 family)
MNSNNNAINETNFQTNKLNKTGSERFVKQTSNKQTKTNTNFYNITTLLAFRINVIAKEKYMELSPQKKKIVKLILESAILSLSDDKEDLERVAKELGIELAKNNIQPIININVNEAHSEAKVNIDITKILELVNELESLLVSIQKYNFNAERNAYVLPPARMKDLQQKLNELKKMVN